MWKGRLINKSTRALDAKTARSIEARIRSELALGNWGILEPEPVSTLAEFLRADLKPFLEAKHSSTPKTLNYYNYGMERLKNSEIAKLPLDKVTDQHAKQFAAAISAGLTVSTINCPLRTLRHAMKLACEWGKIDRAPKITLAKGERQRERVLTDNELKTYLAACPQPWRDVATIISHQGYRPDEVYTLQWPQVCFSGTGGLIVIVNGKSKAARRILPMLPEVYAALKRRHEAQGQPADGWVFPSEAALRPFRGRHRERAARSCAEESQ